MRRTAVVTNREISHMLTRRQAFFTTTALAAVGATGTAQAADKVIKVGVDLSLTGADSQGANRVKNAIVMAFEAANEAHTVPGYRFDQIGRASCRERRKIP